LVSRQVKDTKVTHVGEDASDVTTTTVSQLSDVVVRKIEEKKVIGPVPNINVQIADLVVREDN